MPAVTVLLPTYEASATIELAVRSILRQSFTDFELIVMDDGSRDDTALRVSAMVDPRIRLIRGEHNEGLATRLNQGIEAARGVCIARMDADDVAYPERLERQHRFMAEHPEVDLLGSRAIVFGSSGEAVGLLPFLSTHEGLCARPWNGIPLAHPTWFGRTAWFRRFRYAIPEFVRAEDQELLLRASASSLYACLPEVLLGYRRTKPSARRVARASQFHAQWRYALLHRRWRLAAMAALVWAGKRGIDLVSSLPGPGAFHPGGGREPVSAAEVSRWMDLWQSLQEVGP